MKGPSRSEFFFKYLTYVEVWIRTSVEVQRRMCWFYNYRGHNGLWLLWVVGSVRLLPSLLCPRWVFRPYSYPEKNNIYSSLDKSRVRLVAMTITMTIVTSGGSTLNIYDGGAGQSTTRFIHYFIKYLRSSLITVAKGLLLSNILIMYLDGEIVPFSHALSANGWVDR